MVPASLTAICIHRLADHLQRLSEVTESLTYRLLELEERLAAQELKLRPLLESSIPMEPGLADEMELRLDDTEERLARIEGMLNGLERPGAARHLQPVQSLPFQQEPVGSVHARGAAIPDADDAGATGEGQLSEASPFLEEGEQAFMDELTA